ncbi:uncharacterized protein LOC134854572 [Symsagittifera roscoffensis]|uniref:uncharacterized protein LOC134854572 n=1 Tax=Symsagittifera roscoffensis TaxID=84072 RepID=UPI00307C2D47
MKIILVVFLPIGTVPLLCQCLFSPSDHEMLARSSSSPSSPSSEKWGSWVFWLANRLGMTGAVCKKHSEFYCLDCYRTQRKQGLPFSSSNHSLSPLHPAAASGMPLDPNGYRLWFGSLIRSQWRKINMIDEADPYECCEEQTRKYMQNGLTNRQMSPYEYMLKLTDYDDEHNKPLNHISAFYIPDICQNAILEVGFGPGKLQRDHFRGAREGASYLIMGQEFGQAVGIPDMNSSSFPYEDPGRFLTFHWFKHNIMCRDHLWICEPNSLRRHLEYSMLREDILKSSDDSTSGSKDEWQPRHRARYNSFGFRKDRKYELRRRRILSTIRMRQNFSRYSHLNKCS